MQVEDSRVYVCVCVFGVCRLAASMDLTEMEKKRSNKKAETQRRKRKSSGVGSAGSRRRLFTACERHPGERSERRGTVNHSRLDSLSRERGRERGRMREMQTEMK